MNPNYSSPRPFNPPPPPPFYNPQPPKEGPPGFSPALTRSPNSMTYAHSPPLTNTQPSSKSYTLKHNFESTKTGSNSSAYLKSTLQVNPPPSSFSTFPTYPKAAEMTKSSFHDAPRFNEQPYAKTTERMPLAVNVPPRRLPRYSEPVNMQSPYEPPQTKATFTPFGSSKGIEPPKEETQVHFYKKHGITSPEVPKEREEDKPREVKEWIRKTPPSHSQSNASTTASIIGNNSNSTNNSPNSTSKSRVPVLDSFQLIRNVGQGKYGKVFLARQKHSGFICALKVIEKAVLIEQQIVDQFIRQVKIQIFLNHSNIIKMYGCFEDKEHIYVVLEIAMGGQLYQQLKRSEPMPEAKVASLMKQICTAVDELHSNRVIHRDIKPENIVLHEGVVKLCDFGWSVHLDNKMRTTFCGTPLYVCPEILRGKEYDEKIDIWSIGIMMYEMLVGESPFKINKEEELIKIVKDEIAIPSYVYVSADARDFLDKCLQKNPNDRVTIKELNNHPFLFKNLEKTEKKLNF